MSTARRLILLAGAIGLATPALAQRAEIEVQCPGGGSFQWTPVTVTLRLIELGPGSLAEVRGSVVITSNSGNATGMVQNFSSQFSGPFVNLGSFSGLSRTGMRVAALPNAYPTGTYTIAQYEIMVDQPGQIFYARWMPDPGFEKVRMHISPVLPAIVPINTSNLSEYFYVGGCCPPPFCRPDLTGSAIPTQPAYGIPDFTLNTDDFFYFLDRFTQGDRNRCDMTASATPGTPGFGQPDGALNNDDFFFYLSIYAAGC